MTATPAAPARNTSYLQRPEGRIGYDVAGAGPLVVLVPGMGDLRAGYRFLAPALREAGYRVACTDLRGHGDSDTTFTSYGDQETAGDLIALIEELSAPAVVIGNSMGAGSAALAAAQRPGLVSGLVLIGPFVRNATMSALKRILLRAARPGACLSRRQAGPRGLELALSVEGERHFRTGHDRLGFLSRRRTSADSTGSARDVSRTWTPVTRGLAFRVDTDCAGAGGVGGEARLVRACAEGAHVGLRFRAGPDVLLHRGFWRHRRVDSIRVLPVLMLLQSPS